MEAMQIRVVTFGVLKDWLGISPVSVELGAGATVGELLAQLQRQRPSALLQGIAVGVNGEFVQAGWRLKDGDEVALLPPVSGGAPRTANDASRTTNPDEAVQADGEETVWLTFERIEAGKIASDAREDADGALVAFEGVVRNQTRGRSTLHLDYEAYELMALGQMKALAAEARERFAVRDVWMVHRLGRLLVGETSVVIVVASAHRGAAFEACRWLIDTLKKTVPIWKRETFVDGAVWADGEAFPAELAVDGAAGGGA
jgi:molybdopterin synthase catalytic subunit